MTLPDFGPYFSGARSTGLVVGTLLLGVGLLPSFDPAAFTQAITDLSEGTRLVMKGGGALLLIVLPIWGALKGRLSSKVADVKVAAPGELATAMAQVKPAEMVAAVNALSSVQTVLTTPDAAGRALAAEVPSSTVVQAGTPAAVQLAKAA